MKLRLRKLIWPALILAGAASLTYDTGNIYIFPLVALGIGVAYLENWRLRKIEREIAKKKLEDEEERYGNYITLIDLFNPDGERVMHHITWRADVVDDIARATNVSLSEDRRLEITIRPVKGDG